MTDKILHASLSRITDLERVGFDCQPLPREQWELGDYVVGSATIARGGFSAVELTSGRVAHAVNGDSVLGALAVRHATLEVVGSWEAVGADGHMHLLSAGGLLGRTTSVSGMLASPMRVDYRGHATRGGAKLRMQDFAKAPSRTQRFEVPTILIIGTSMSAGKTTCARVIVRELKRTGYRVAGAKLTGAGRYRDILAMQDAGADTIFDFVDVGLPSSVVEREHFRPRLRDLLGLVAEARPDVVVAEAGASPLEPYNGDTALEELRGSVVLTVLCASDPYSVMGVMHGYDMMRPDVVAGVATSTSAGVEVIEKQTGTEALNMLDAESLPQLRRLLARVVPAHRG